ncbi:alpha/beta fold hydrolase [Ornithinimicrobium sp. LYQ103]|uniref:alpha/beta fold hydrolase n=1 Tax=Ornithinimicrobium sp. LYQ103 TaxID=3378796 RepID=UPI003851D9D9
MSSSTDTDAGTSGTDAGTRGTDAGTRGTDLLALRGHWLTPDTGRDLLVVGPSLGTGVVALWDECAGSVAAGVGFDVLGWDLPGHGDSDPCDEPFTLEDVARAVVALVDVVRPGEGFVHAGVSVGGAVGLVLAVGDALGSSAQRVRGSVVCCSGARIGTPEGWHERADLVRRAGTPVMVEGSAQRWFAPGFLEREPRTGTGLLTTLQHADKDSYARVCEALAQHDVVDRLGAITVPVLVLGGRHDAVCTPEQQQELAGQIPGASLVIVEGAAHLAPAEQPTEVAGVLLDWLEGLR